MADLYTMQIDPNIIFVKVELKEKQDFVILLRVYISNILHLFIYLLIYYLFINLLFINLLFIYLFISIFIYLF